MKLSASPKPASGPVRGLTWPILMAFDCAWAGIARNTAGIASAPRPPATTVRRLRTFLTSFMSSSSSAIARSLQMLHDFGPERGLLLGAPLAKTFARFEPQPAVGHKPLQIGRRARPPLDRWQDIVVNGEREIGSYHVGVFQRTEHCEPAAERSLDNGIDRLGIADTVLDQRNRLAPQRVLKPVADETWHVFFHVGRLLAGGLVQFHGPGDRLWRCPLRLDDFHERHQERRIPPMRAERALALVQSPHDRRDRNDRSVAGEDRMGTHVTLDLGKQ